MENKFRKCTSKDHENIDAIFYCSIIQIYFQIINYLINGRNKFKKRKKELNIEFLKSNDEEEEYDDELFDPELQLVT